MVINKTDLLNKLSMVYPIVKKNSSYEGFTVFRFDGAKLSARNGVMGISTTLVQDIGLHCNIAAQEFFSLISSILGNELDIVQEGNLVKVKAGAIKGKFTTKDYEPIPDFGPGYFVEANEETTAIIQKMDFCVNGVCKDPAEGMLCGVILDPKAQALLSSDKYRICRAKADISSLFNPEKEAEPFSLPVPFVDYLNTFINEVAGFQLSENGSKFGVLLEGDTLLYTTVYDDNYFDLSKFFPNPGDPSVEIKFAEQFQAAVKRHIDFLTDVSKLDKELVIQIQNGACTIWSENDQLGKVEEEIILVTEAQELLFGINPLFLKELGSKATEFRFYPERALVVFNIQGNDYLINARG